MITFLEYSYNLDQTIELIKNMRSELKEMPGDNTSREAKAKNNAAIIKTYVSISFLDKITDTARADLTVILLNIINNYVEAWDDIGIFLQKLWDQPVYAPGKTLGGELLNKMSAQVMHNIGADIFISYSGKLSKGTVHRYTGKYPRTFEVKKNYRWGPFNTVIRTISSDYTEHFNNQKRFSS